MAYKIESISRLTQDICKLDQSQMQIIQPKYERDSTGGTFYPSEVRLSFYEADATIK